MCVSVSVFIVCIIWDYYVYVCCLFVVLSVCRFRLSCLVIILKIIECLICDFCTLHSLVLIFSLLCRFLLVCGMVLVCYFVYVCVRLLLFSLLCVFVCQVLFVVICICWSCACVLYWSLFFFCALLCTLPLPISSAFF